MSEKFKVVFVDDEEILCKLVKMIVRSKSAEVVAYSSPLLAIEACNETPPDLILTDFNMPGMDGVELANKMPKGIPTYLMTGGLPDEVQLGFKFDGILDKPFDFEKITEIIDFWVKEKEDSIKIVALP